MKIYNDLKTLHSQSKILLKARKEKALAKERLTKQTTILFKANLEKFYKYASLFIDANSPNPNIPPLLTD